MKRPLALVTTVVVLLLVELFLAESGGAVAEYTGATRQPCIACHTTGSGPDLNARGQAFAAIPTHKTDPVGAWAEVERTMPASTPTVGSSLTVTVLVGGLFVGVTVYLLVIQMRRRQA